MLEETVHQIRDQIRRLRSSDLSQYHRVQRLALKSLRLGDHLLRQMSLDSCPQRAAALAYTTILSLVPVVALFVTYIKMAGKLDAAAERLQTWILHTIVAESAQGVTTYIDQFVANIHTRAIGTFGIGALLIATYLLFRTVEKSLNEIWQIRSHRRFWARLQMLSTLLVIVPTLIFASLFITGKIQEFKFLDRYDQFTWITRAFFMIGPFLFTTLSLFVLFKIVPNTKVYWKPALASAFFSAMLFEIGKWGFNLYVVEVLPVSKIYGSIALIPIFLLWIYVSWLIVLIGVELAFTMQNFSTLQAEFLEKDMKNPLKVPLHEEWGWRVTCQLLEIFRNQERPVRLDDLAANIPLPVRVIEDHLDLLIENRVIGRIDGSDVDSFVPVQPAESIREDKVVNLFRDKLGLTPK